MAESTVGIVEPIAVDKKVLVINLPILFKKIKFWEIDWEYFFRQVLSMGYSTPNDFLSRLDNEDFDKAGRVINMSKLIKVLKKNGWDDPAKFLDKELKPRMNELINYMKTFGADISLIRLSLIGKFELTKVDEQRLQIAVVNFCMQEFEWGNVSRAFEIMEGVFPLVLDSFSIFEKNLPKILQRGYIEKTPECVRDCEFNHRVHFSKKGFEGEELEELTAQMVRYPQLVWIWRELLRQKSFKLKSENNIKGDGLFLKI